MGASLSEHRFDKGKFIAPFNDGIFKEIIQENPWFYNRLPDYLWLALILDYYGRADGLLKCRDVLQILLKHVPGISFPKLSIILNLDTELQTNFYTEIKQVLAHDVLEPLTAVFTYSHYPSFALAFSNTSKISDRIKRINDVLHKYYFHQSNEATDVRYLIAVFLMLDDKLHMPPFQIDNLLKYPTLSHDDIEIRLIRSFIRALEVGMPDEMTPDKEKYLFNFWDGMSKMSDCSLFYFEIDDQCLDANEFMSQIKTQLNYYVELFQGACPLDSKMLVLLGMATYAYKRLLEVVEHDLYNTITGRSIIRVLIENYIMMKYLLKHEAEHEDIWTEYQYYGIGQYKLVVERFHEGDVQLPDSHVAYDYIDLIVSEYKNKDFIDMDTTYFDKKKIREKAIDVDEKDLFGLYYDYDSAFEHGLWGAIRESSLLKCNTASHQYHCVPDIDNLQKMKSVWPDCRKMMIKTMALLNSIYGCPEHLLLEGGRNE